MRVGVVCRQPERRAGSGRQEPVKTCLRKPDTCRLETVLVVGLLCVWELACALLLLLKCSWAELRLCRPPALSREPLPREVQTLPCVPQGMSGRRPMQVVWTGASDLHATSGTGSSLLECSECFCPGLCLLAMVIC